ncbi:MAG: dipicolinate synthase subunit DpsA [Lachnospiraceae bacterium]
MRKVLVLGGDARSHFLGLYLQGKTDMELVAYGNPFSKPQSLSQVKLFMEQADTIVLPVPYTVDGIHLKWGDSLSRPMILNDVLDGLHENQLILGSNFKNDFVQNVNEKGAKIFDFMKAKEIAKRNSVATAEGTIAEAIMLCDSNLEKSDCMVIGYGICGKEIAGKLARLGAKVTVMARREEIRRECADEGYETLPMFSAIDRVDKEIQLIVNTVPSMVLDEKALKKMASKNFAIIDIASNPGGTDFAYCKVNGIKAKLCLGLPGKYSPRSSGDILGEYVWKIWQTQEAERIETTENNRNI